MPGDLWILGFIRWPSSLFCTGFYCF